MPNLGNLNVVAALVLSSALVAGCQQETRQISAHDVYVIDGDTIALGDERFRLLGYDTPEVRNFKCAGEHDLGRAATDRLKHMLATAGKAELQISPEKDKYNRGLANLLLDGKDVGPVLISEGLARAYIGGKRSGWC
ncbi:Thermonuclease precursor (plasmid) [Phaeobacter piscinae]|uniref:Thermonuclease n=1 Tax=Phaeobacter piscinae TaxID=1580596 RepID=A0ABM6PJT6_9RHOB|nr:MULTISPECIES: thermonuclease family protein [Phaeobacter]ATG38104.1 Thermonuclease precursor [Phaeobacter piscinae]AUQ88625.1 Thermonuclease precursor [Phaeobacter piscinae]AUQ92624.1 Thermonuclease precursor [Phaeobacter inhibens]AUR26430.1 Thermonuclease precursor [Phaeobacter piscinae]